ncbi:uncharacterized protein LOC116417738 [Nasonia vitripennis]|uniref:Endonuclease/exonuclease/phosphatase domain-containing protein n=1 Tax=Nasonia vitripennis TaxID=7425 RepID=A0A7M7QLH0_NASVI|nr:uncharacterized protein LOC116417738 [Nasonia vitripennis]
MDLTILQCNLNGSSFAHSLLPQIAAEMDADVLVISEQYRNRIDSGAGEDYSCTRVGSVTIVSVYLSPNNSAREYEDKLKVLEDVVRDLTGDVIKAGDFNARAIEWGMPTTNRRGRLILQMAVRLELEVVNDGNMTTYKRPGFGNSIPDITLATDRILTRLRGWKVIEDYTASDHQYIVFNLTNDATSRQRQSMRTTRWDIGRINRDEIKRQLRNVVIPSADLSQGRADRAEAERSANDLEKYLQGISEAAMPRKRYRQDRRQTYWWTQEIAEIRKACLRHRRLAGRERDPDEREAISREYKLARRLLRQTINSTKQRRWRRLEDEVESDLWGEGYKIVTRKLGAWNPPETKDADTLVRIVHDLFPTHQDRTDDTDMDNAVECPLFTVAELESAAAKLKPRKAPGPDRVPGELL